MLFRSEEHNFTYDYAQLLLKNLLAIENKVYKTDKLNKLKTLKEELEERNLLIKDDYFKVYLKRFELFHTGSAHDKLSKNLLIKIKAKEINKTKTLIANKELLLFDTLAEECEYLYQKIAELLHDGVKLNEIKVLGLDDAYNKHSVRLSDFFGIYFNNIKKPLSSYQFVKSYLKNLNETKSFGVALNILKEKYNEKNPKYYDLYRGLIRQINKVENLSFSFETKYIIFKSLLNNNKYSERYKNQIEVLSSKSISLKEDDHLFIIGFNQSILPESFKDDDYLSDKEKQELNLDTSLEKNKIYKEQMKNIILSTKNLYISANLYDGVQSRKVSSLADELELTTIMNPKFENIYNIDLAKFNLAKYLDDFIKYDIEHPNLFNYNSSLKIDYINYYNSFSGIDNEALKQRLQNKLVLSYSSLDKFNHCAFKYYVDHILKISKYEDSFAIVLGNLFHLVLSKWTENNIDPLVTWEDEIKKLSLKKSEETILNNLKEELLFVFEEIKKFHDETEFKDIKSEVELMIDIDEKTAFKGFVDKIMHLNKDGEDELVLIDYKTGSTELNLKNINFGFDLQLPIYWYLISRSKLFKEARFTGLYIHNLLSKPSFLTASQSLEEEKKKELKLYGYSTKVIDRLARFDKTIESSEFISGVSLTGAGELKKSNRLLSDEDISEMDKIGRAHV